MNMISIKKTFKYWAGETKKCDEVSDTWHSVNASINRHIEISPIYQPIKQGINKYNIRGENNNSKHANHSYTPTDNNHPNFRLKEQAASQLQRNSHYSIFIEVCADDVDRDNECFTIMLSNPENQTQSKSSS